jgi:hypothetical protein
MTSSAGISVSVAPIAIRYPKSWLYGKRLVFWPIHVARLKEAMLEHLVENFHAPGLQLKWTRPRQSLSQCAVPVDCDDGLPQGVQLIGARFREDLLLDAAQAIEDRATSLTPI